MDRGTAFGTSGCCIETREGFDGMGWCVMSGRMGSERLNRLDINSLGFATALGLAAGDAMNDPSSSLIL